MAALVIELQRQATDTTVPVTRLLLTAKLTASKLSLGETQSWIEHELNGYSASDEAASYRTVRGTVRGRKPSGEWIPVKFADMRKKELLSTFFVRQPIPSIEEILDRSDKADFLHVPYGVQEFTINDLPFDVETALGIDRSQLAAIMSAV